MTERDKMIRRVKFLGVQYVYRVHTERVHIDGVSTKVGGVVHTRNLSGVHKCFQVYTGVKFLALNEPEDDMGWHARLQVEPYYNVLKQVEPILKCLQI